MTTLAESDQPTIRAWQQDARKLLAARNFSAAERCCEKILNRDPRNAEATFVLAMLALETQQIGPAAQLLQRAASLDGTKPEYLAQLARVLVMLQETGRARAAALKALQLEPADALTLDTLGCVLSHSGDHATAIEPFTTATRLEPNNPDFQFNLASSLRFLGDFDAAESAYEQAIAQAPHFYKAHWSLANLRRQTPEKNHIARLRKTLEHAAGNLDGQTFLHNALAKELEDTGDTVNAFRHLNTGKALLRKTLDYSVDEDAELFSCIREEFTAALLHEDTAGHSSNEPIFVVGMPRTGTTLVERILSSHSDVFSAGELRSFGLMLKRAAGTRSNKVLDPDTVRQGLRANPAQLGQDYLDSTRPATGHTPRFIDKTPLNFLNIGFIHRALPNARIVCVRRNPMDTCLSNFRHLFSPESSPYYRYSFDLLETGHYYLLFNELMTHWNSVLPGKILQVQYEDIVADQETQSRRLLGFCGLEWQDACLRFEQNAAPVATASSVQVRQPIYSSATERWKSYAEFLQPLKELLEQNGIQV